MSLSLKYNYIDQYIY